MGIILGQSLYPYAPYQKDLMVKLMSLIKAAIGAVLLNDAVRNALIGTMTKSKKGRSSKIPQVAMEGVLASTLLRSMKGDKVLGPAIISAISAFLLSMRNSNEGHHSKKGRVVDIDDYTVINEK